MTVSNKDWATLSSRLECDLRFVSETPQVMNRAGKSVVSGFLRKFSVKSGRSLTALAAAVAVRDACQDTPVSTRVERCCRDVPFSDMTNFEIIRRVRTLAHCQLSRCDPAAARELEPYLAVPGNDHRLSPLTLSEPMRFRMTGPGVRDRSEMLTADTPGLRLLSAANRYLELSFIQAFGGSDEWSSERTREELEWTRGLIRDQALAPGA